MQYINFIKKDFFLKLFNKKERYVLMFLFNSV